MCLSKKEDVCHPAKSMAPLVTSATLTSSPRQVMEGLIELAVEKSKYTLDQRFILAFMAGAFIAMGGMLSSMSAGRFPRDGGMGSAVQSLVAGMTFPLGIILVVFTGSDLFTSNCMSFPVATFVERRISVWRMLYAMSVTWMANMLGACFVGFFFVWLPHSDTHLSDPDKLPQWITGYLIRSAEARANPSWYSILINGIGCNMLVCLSVWIGSATREGAGKIMGLHIPIASFVLMEFQHCVANGFTVPTGMMFGANVSAWGLVKNYLSTTLGNIIGGTLFIGLALHYSNSVRADHPHAVRNTGRKIMSAISSKYAAKKQQDDRVDNDDDDNGGDASGSSSSSSKELDADPSIALRDMSGGNTSAVHQVDVNESKLLPHVNSEKGDVDMKQTIIDMSGEIELSTVTTGSKHSL